MVTDGAAPVEGQRVIRCLRSVRLTQPFGATAAPMSQKIGMNRPMMNITQWPFRRDMMPSVISKTI